MSGARSGTRYWRCFDKTSVAAHGRGNLTTPESAPIFATVARSSTGAGGRFTRGTSEINKTGVGFSFDLENSIAMDANSRKAGLTRLPLWTAVFVALVCVVILAVTGAREWSARQSDLVAAEVSMGG